MNPTILHNGKNYFLYKISAFGRIRNLFMVPTKYRENGALAVVVNEVGHDGTVEHFGVLTINLPQSPVSESFAFCKTYSENEGWAEALLKSAGAVKTNRFVYLRYATAVMYDFSNVKFYEK